MCVRISDGVGVVFSLSAGGERTGQVLLLYVGHAVPQVAAQLRTDGLQLVQNVPYFGAVRAFLIRAALLLPGIVARAAQLTRSFSAMRQSGRIIVMSNFFMASRGGMVAKEP